MRLRFLLLATAAACLLAAPAVAQAVPTTFTGTAGTAASGVNAFKAAAGSSRTIDWESVPDTLQEPRALPGQPLEETQVAAPRVSLEKR